MANAGNNCVCHKKFRRKNIKENGRRKRRTDMGLIQVAAASAGTVLADQWKEYFYCPSLDNDTLAVKGQVRQQKRAFNTKRTDNIISQGSIVTVNDGQCMIIVDQGEIVEICAEPGAFQYDQSTEPSIFYGNLKESVRESFRRFAHRVGFGGDTGNDQRVYYFNTKDIIGNKYGTATPIPFRVVDRNIGLDMDIAIRCHGEYAFRITDPILFYKNICGNVENDYTKDRIESQMRSELLTALQPAFARISEMGVRYSAVPAHSMELGRALDQELTENWGGHYGISITAIGVNSITASEEDEKTIKELQKNAVLSNPAMAAAHLTAAQADAMKAAAANTSAGPMMAFAGMNMANMAGGMNAGSLFGMAAQQQAAAQQAAAQSAPSGAAPAPAASNAASWDCECGHKGNTGKFCSECGKERPQTGELFWTCSCGAKNKGRFCSECGKAKPAGIPQYRCDKCGWEPEDPTRPPKFCPNCGDPFDDGDIVR